MVRTELVNLSTIPASAYRQKLKDGGAGIVILRAECKQPGMATISKTSGEPILDEKNPKKYYPKKAFQEAITLTARLPYNKRSIPKLEPVEKAPEKKAKPVVEVQVNEEDVKKIVDKYTDKKGKFSIPLMNQDLIKFSHCSKVVRDMIADKASEKKIRLYVAGTKFRNITGNEELTDKQVLKIAEILDGMGKEGVFSELNAEIRRKLKK